jgi:Bacterial SH3 domain
MRDQPSTKGVMVGSLPNGTKVDIVRVVEGEAIDPAEDRWYLVKFEIKTGYVYFKLLAAE